MKLILFYNVAAQLAREKGISLSDAYSKVREMGYSGVDPLVWGDTGDDMKAFRAAAEGSGLCVPACSGMFPLYRDDDYDKGRRFIDSARELGAKSAMILPAYQPEGMERDEAREKLVPYISRLCDYAESAGIVLSMENFSRFGYPFSLISDFELLLREIPKLKMTFDTGNFIWVGESPSEAIDRICAVRKQPFSHVHMKNYSRTRYNDYPKFNGRDIGGEGFYSYPTVSGGMADLGYICEKLKAIGYDGCVSVENGGIFPAEPAVSDSAAWLTERLNIDR